MVEKQLEVSGKSTASSASVWAIARDFCSDWHPAIEKIHCQSMGQPNGHLPGHVLGQASGHTSSVATIRAFTVYGDATLYREQLIYHSDSCRTLRYSHLSGIKEVENYVATLTVEDDANGGSCIHWSAIVVADKAHAERITSGTQAIFQAGIAALAAQAESCTGPARPPTAQLCTPATPASVAALQTLTLSGQPTLTATTTTAPTAAPCCLFLHGIGGSRHNWRVQQTATTGKITSAALDLRGYADSEAGPNQSTVDDYCADILRLRSALGADKIVLCGLSYGAWIATSFAMRYPQLLAGLVLSGGCTGMSEASEQVRDAFRQSREVPLNKGYVPADFASEVVKVIAGPTASPEQRQQLLDSMAAISAATYRDALTCFTQPTEQFDFSKLTMPVLLLTGAHDPLAPPAEIQAVAMRIVDSVLAAPAVAELPNVRFEIIANAGHVCNLENPQQYNALLVEFLSAIAAGNQPD